MPTIAAPSVLKAIDLKSGDTFDFVGGSWHGPSIVIENDRSGSEPTMFDVQGGLRRLTYSNPQIVNPPGLTYIRDLQEVVA